MITAAWTTGKYAALNKGAAPNIRVEDVWRSPLLHNLFFKNDWHAIYPHEEGEDEV